MGQRLSKLARIRVSAVTLRRIASFAGSFAMTKIQILDCGNLFIIRTYILQMQGAMQLFFTKFIEKK